VVPILLLLVFNVADAGWAISQQNAIRGAAREAARLAATQNWDDANIAAAVCSDIHRVNPAAVTVSIVSSGTDLGTVTVTYSPYDTLTDTPWSLIQLVSGISSSLQFRIDGSNPSPAWLGATAGGCA
jgi:Flp pilus assembly protein TadG